jgi:hypothetical protein
MILELTDKLRNRLTDFRNSDLHKNSKIYRCTTRLIEIALNLSELTVENEVVINSSDKHWFEGSYLIDHDFNGEWSDISDLYSQLIDELIDKKYIEM